MIVAVKTTFDGRTIRVPPELRGAQAGEILVIFDERQASAARPSIWNVFGAASTQRTAADLEAQIRQERGDWGDR